MARIIRRPRAQLDLFELWDYIATESGSNRADAFIDTIERTLHTLAEHSGIGRRRDELKPGLRSHPVGRYLIFYFPLDDGIRVSRVLHGARDLEAIFDEEED